MRITYGLSLSFLPLFSAVAAAQTATEAQVKKVVKEFLESEDVQVEERGGFTRLLFIDPRTKDEGTPCGPVRIVSVLVQDATLDEVSIVFQAEMLGTNGRRRARRISVSTGKRFLDNSTSPDDPTKAKAGVSVANEAEETPNFDSLVKSSFTAEFAEAAEQTWRTPSGPTGFGNPQRPRRSLR